MAGYSSEGNGKRGQSPDSCPMKATEDSATECFLTSDARLFWRDNSHDQGLHVSGHGYVRALSARHETSQLAGGAQEATPVCAPYPAGRLQQGPIIFRASLCLFYSVTNNVPCKVEPSSGKAGDVLVVRWNILSIFFHIL